VTKLEKRETPLLDRVFQYRKNEIESLGKSSQVKALNQGLFFGSLTLVCMVGFGTFVALGNSLDPSTIFSAVFLFSVIQQPFTGFFPTAVEGLTESRISIARIEKFLALPEIEFFSC
jgi:ABC-type bacteriocin/lantibiotic exporter with double-glycine peptidase domain